MTDPQQTGPIGSRVLYEDEQVRIWDMTLAPGEDSGRHHHENPYVIAMIAGDRIGLHEHVDAVDANYRESEVVVGRSLFLPAGGIETAVNIGSTTYRDIQIELL